MSRHLILGAGGIGRSVAMSLAAAGEDVVLASRSGRDAHVAGVSALALDVTDRDALRSAATGAATLVNALNPSLYYRWQKQWPPMADSILDASEGTRLVTVSNLYLYGRVDAPMTEETTVAPNGAKGRVRARMFEDAMARHKAGRVRAVEVRASDYLGPHTLASSFGSGMVLPPLLAGKTPRPPMGVADAPHSWTLDLDVAALIAALILRDDADDWGRAWHVPTDEPATLAELAELAAGIAGVDSIAPRPLPRAVVTVGGLVVPILHALWETRHQFERPFVLDSSAAQARFGLAPTPLRRGLELTVEALRREAGAH
ncbi:NAD-dependent epimerase [Tessaracoccus sp. MC1679]|uniref:NAD-dependent epimerase/dehydratase family protein n=1 Tax=Tessaracoccus sp. MC1679 TaxID=2760313 RepID=UPI0016017972|nr:NAD-dependent epimerase/dehydratase family protein [Tessaracoccus sp. MC1679]MBB1515585.1 NAD-dependent epimerase [Tessaracoccus sp. MC1679]